jgi:hypothetical protein
MHDIDFGKKGTLKLHIRKFLLYPPQWSDRANQLPRRLKWRCCKFVRRNQRLMPKSKGIYCFVVKPTLRHFFSTMYLFYSGKTCRTLYTRYGEYLKEQENKRKARPKVLEMLTLYKGHLYFYYAAITASDTEIAQCEESLLNAFVPHINTDIPRARIRPELQHIYE